MSFTAELSAELPLSSAHLGELGVIIPTYNAARHWPALKEALDLQPISPAQILIIDSSSSDGTRELARASGYKVVCIRQEEFGHGVTRQAACDYLPQADMLLFLTQDAVLDKPTSVERLCDALEDPKVGAAFGRQLPRREANGIEAHARLFNYPAVSEVRTFESRHRLGIKAAFFSNSFALYRRSALEAVGGFPADVILGEDFYVAAKLLIAGWKVAYRADATAVHSHRLSFRQEFSRYFDIGVHHGREAWMLETFGKADSEGMRFVRSELRYLRANDMSLIPSALLRSAIKMAAYKLGHHEHHLTPMLNRLLSSNPGFWQNREGTGQLRRRVRSFLPKA